MKRFGYFIFALVLISINPEYLLACSCSGESSVKDAAKYSEIVLNGVVLSKTITMDLLTYGVKVVGDPNLSLYTSMLAKTPIAVFKIRVLKIYKGKSSADTISVITAASGASCGIPFQIGANYIVYGTTDESLMRSNSFRRSSTNNKTYWTHRCSRTSFYSKDEEKAIISLKP
jgi:hypothetical protein